MATVHVPPIVALSPPPLNREPQHPVGESPKKMKRLSKEERLLLKRQKKILNKQKALETRKQSFRDFLERELKYAETNYKRGASQWEAMCKAYKGKELREEIITLSQGIKRTVDFKDIAIQRMLTDLDSAEQNYRRHFSKHAEILGYLIKIHKHFVDITKAAFEEDAAYLMVEFQEDMQERTATLDRHKLYYENVHHATDLIADNILNELENRYTENFNELRDTHVVRRMNFHNTTLLKMEQMRSHMLKIVSDLQMNAQSPERLDRYNQYLQRREKTKKDMERFRRKSKQSHSILLQKQSELLSLEAESSASIAKLRGERSYFVELYWGLKKKCKKLALDQDDHIKHLALESNGNIEKLKKIQRYGELVLSLAAYCRKLQTEKEKITPWTEEGVEMYHEEANEENDNPLQSMQLFWNHVGQAETHVLCLREERVELKRQNEELLEIIKSYMEKLNNTSNKFTSTFSNTHISDGNCN